MHFRGRLQRDRAVAVRVPRGKIVLLGINMREEAMRPGIGGIAFHRFA